MVPAPPQAEGRSSSFRPAEGPVEGSKKGLIIGIAIVGVACLVGIVVALTQSGSSDSTEKRAGTGTSPSGWSSSPPVLPTPLDTPKAKSEAQPEKTEEEYNPRAFVADSKLASAKQAFATKPDDVWGYHAKLDELVKDYAGTPAAEEAKKLMAGLKLPAGPPPADLSQATTKPPDNSVWGKSIDLLGISAPDRNTYQGKFAPQNGVLTSDGAGWSRLRVPYRPPEEYDLKLVFKRLQGDECLVIGLSIQSHPFTLMLAGWKNRWAGFECIDGKRLNESPLGLDRAPIFENGKKYELIVQVRKNSLQTLLNGQTLVSANVTPDRLSGSMSWDFPYSGDRGLGLGTIGPYEFYEMRLLPVSGGEGKKLDLPAVEVAAAKPAEPKPEAAKPKPAPPVQENMLMEFDFSQGSALGWSAQKGLDGFAFSKDGLVTATTAADANMILGNMNLNTSLVTHVTLRVKCDKAGEIRVGYTTSGSPKFEKNEMASVRCPGDFQWHEYTLKLAGLKNYEGQLRSLRLDLVNGDAGVGAKVIIRWIRLISRE